MECLSRAIAILGIGDLVRIRGGTPSASSGERGMIKQIRSFQAVISSVEKMSNAGRVGRGSSTLRGPEEEKALESRPEWER